MAQRLFKNKMAMICIIFLSIIVILGLFAPLFVPNDPLENNILNKFARPSLEYPFGTDQLGRCVLSRVIYGIRPTVFLSVVTMIGTIGIGVLLGVLAGYLGGIVDEVIMRIADVMLSFPSQIMILAVVALLGVDIRNVIIANIAIKWAWYARMIRTTVLQYNNVNYILYSRSIGSSTFYILRKHVLPSIASETVVLASLDTGWMILNISTLSFLGLGVQAPTPEWGAMLSEAKNVMTSNPEQMLIPGIAIILVVSAFNFLGDCLRDAMDPKEVIA